MAVVTIVDADDMDVREWIAHCAEPSGSRTPGSRLTFPAASTP